MDKNNFEYEINSWWKIVMSNGELKINDILYERNDDDPIYDMSIEIAKARGLIKC